MRNYETLFILDPDIPEDDIDGEIERIKGYIEKSKGNVVELDKWGARRLAYEIRKKRQGFYVLVRFLADSSSIHDLDSDLKLDDRILRHIIVKKEDGDQPVNRKED